MEGELQRARATIAAQTAELAAARERAQQQESADGFAVRLRAALTLAAVTGQSAAPVSQNRLLEMIVTTAAQVIVAEAAALFLVDEATEELIFEVVLGGGGVQLKKIRLPLGSGIAGLVAVSGQPIAVSDAQNDARVAGGLTDEGFVPRNVLCVPLFARDRVIGVLGLYDKIGADSFGLGDMELLGHFANQSAVAIEQSRAHQHLGDLLMGALQSSGVASENSAALREDVNEFARDVENDPTFERARQMAELVQTICEQGASESQACQTILQGFAHYLQARDSDPFAASSSARGGL